MNGTALSFSETDLSATAAAYDPAIHEAPIVCGHPKNNAPAYGWISGLSLSAGSLEATTDQVNPDFAEMVKTGAFKKVSASFYAPDSPNNPVPGVYYLRHVGFLGAQPPAIKGLRSPEFADTEQGIVEFSDVDDVQNASLWRRLRDWMIGEKGLAVADNILPDYTISSLEQAAKQEDDDTFSTPSQFSEPTKGNQMTPDEKAHLESVLSENAAKDARIAELEKSLANFAEAEKNRTSKELHDGHVAFSEALIKQGRLLPAHKDVTIATMDNMTLQDKAVEFGEAKQPLIEAYKAQLLAMPVIVNFGEMSGGSVSDKFDPEDSTALAARAIEFQETEAVAGRIINIAQAVQHIYNKSGAEK